MMSTHPILLWLSTSLFFTNIPHISSRCTTKNSVSNHVLRNHVIKSMKMANAIDCLQQCAKEERCNSINFYLSDVCELSDKTKERSPKNVHYDSTGFYMESIREVKAGSSRNRAALSCNEIKRKHPESCSRPYWLDTNNDGNPTKQMCFMNLTHGVVSSCNATTLSGKCCAFPFVYSGVTYNSCTDVNTNNPKRQWCSLTPVYSSSSWDHCVVQCPTCPTKLGHCCVFPFEYDGKMFDSCTTYKESSGKYWCSRTREYVGSWDHCV